MARSARWAVVAEIPDPPAIKMTKGDEEQAGWLVGGQRKRWRDERRQGRTGLITLESGPLAVRSFDDQSERLDRVGLAGLIVGSCV